MRVVVNGADQDVAEGLALPQLLAGLGLQVGSVVVERNGVALLRSEVLATTLEDGDVLELVKAVAGG
jgi:sulfur carrier protein